MRCDASPVPIAEVSPDDIISLPNIFIPPTHSEKESETLEGIILDSPEQALTSWGTTHPSLRRATWRILMSTKKVLLLD
ncbi:hypothetical protein AVEN_91920-1 [Araneus ventricosus]|uniref:Uncharacterized protein n=1 Tax=Araneus ventricosus TaxID=182803 RepID=A0A4Y2SQR3_ARAVE|nr:hypothetical protein AVEN_228116-1 [Araneus ventricosus]GBN89522.1 hypothetical protein AVEN_91920-1 [Araneus ventricosus]